MAESLKCLMFTTPISSVWLNPQSLLPVVSRDVRFENVSL